VDGVELRLPLGLLCMGKPAVEFGGRELGAVALARGQRDVSRSILSSAFSSSAINAFVRSSVRRSSAAAAAACVSPARAMAASMAAGVSPSRLSRF
jgi:hypothetical protein